MSTTEVQAATPDSRVGNVYMKLENEVIPVSDVDRSKQFYESLGWRLDDDVAPMEALRIVQFTPPGSGTSVTFGKGLTAAAPGAAQAVPVVSDIEVAHAELVGRGIDAADVWHGPPFPSRPANPASIPSAPAIGRSPPSTTPTAICGLSRRSRRGSPAGSPAQHSHPPRTLRVRFGVPSPPTPSTRRARATGSRPSWLSACATRTRRRGTPRTWWRSRPVQTCLRDRPGACRGWPAPRDTT